jgi:dihydropteroate synthase
MNSVYTLTTVLNIGKKAFDLNERTLIMGILNVTPDSFSDGGRFGSVDAAVEHAIAMIEEGADIIDIGGESTRPKGVYSGTRAVTAEEEMNRVIPVIERLCAVTDVPVSIDTTKSVVAEAALRAGASMVNDISGLKFDPRMAETAARYNAVLAVMHIQGTPETMQIDPVYTDVVAEVKKELSRSVEHARSAGVTRIIIDPGIGFGKTLDHNLTLLQHLKEFETLGLPILIGTSRKGFIGTILDLPVDQRLEGTAASVTVSIMHGAKIIRVHDVKAMKRVAMVTDAIKRKR